MYFSNSQARRDLPIPAMPTTESRCALPSSADAWKSSFAIRNSRSRLTKGGSRPAARSAPPRPAVTRTARHRRSGSDLPLTSCAPASSNPIAASAARCVASPTSTPPGGASDCTREAVLTRSPATIPCPWAPIVTAASPVITPARAATGVSSASPFIAATAATSSSAARTASSASCSWATGAPHTAITASPMNFSTVPP